MEIAHHHCAFPGSENRAQLGPVRAHHSGARRRHDGPTPLTRRGSYALDVIGMLVRYDHCFDRVGRDASHRQTLLQDARRKSGVNQDARAVCFEKYRISTAATAKDPQLHQILQRFLCASVSCWRALSPSSTCRRNITRSATAMNLVTSYVS